MIDIVEVICNGEEEMWASRERAEWFYGRAAAGSEGHEQQRYLEILRQLRLGMAVCSDEDV